MALLEGKELLLSVVKRLAAMGLKAGGFIPFGALLGSHRNVELRQPKSAQGTITQDKLESYWIRQLVPAVASGEFKIVCWCASVTIPTERDPGIPCVYIHIEDTASIAEESFYPYRTDEDGEIVFGEPTVVPASRVIFGAKGNQE
jgi:hypothetical protein